MSATSRPGWVALVALQLRRHEQADFDLEILMRDNPKDAELYFARRALARLALGRFEAAESDAANSYRRNPTPSHQRLWIRTLLAAGRVDDLSWLIQPDDISLLPGAGPSITADLRAAVKRLQSRDQNSTLSLPLAHRLQSVLQSALGSPRGRRPGQPRHRACPSIRNRLPRSCPGSSLLICEHPWVEWR
jgi:hypothetical protein